MSAPDVLLRITGRRRVLHREGGCGAEQGEGEQETQGTGREHTDSSVRRGPLRLLRFCGRNSGRYHWQHH